MKKQSFLIHGMIFCLWFIACKGYCKTQLFQPTDIAYVDSGLKELSIQQSEDVAKLELLFANRGFVGLNDNFGDGESFFDVDQVFTDENLTRRAFLKLDLRPLDKNLLETTLLVNKAQIYHGQLKSGVYYTLYFSDFENSEVTEVVKSLRAEVDAVQTAFLENVKAKAALTFSSLFLNSAYASGSFQANFERKGVLTVHGTTPAQKVPTRNFSSYIQKENTPRDSLKESLRITREGIHLCIKNFGQGIHKEVKEATLGTAKRIIKGVGQTVKETAIGTSKFVGRSLKIVSSHIENAASFVRTGKVKHSLKEIYSIVKWEMSSKRLAKVSHIFKNFNFKTFMAEQLGDMKKGKSLEEKCKLFGKVAGMVGVFTGSLFIPAGTPMLVWDSISRANSVYQIKEFIDKQPDPSAVVIVKDKVSRRKAI